MKNDNMYNEIKGNLYLMVCRNGEKLKEIKNGREKKNAFVSEMKNDKTELGLACKEFIRQSFDSEMDNEILSNIKHLLTVTADIDGWEFDENESIISIANDIIELYSCPKNTNNNLLNEKLDKFLKSQNKNILDILGKIEEAKSKEEINKILSNISDEEASIKLSLKDIFELCCEEESVKKQEELDTLNDKEDQTQEGEKNNEEVTGKNKYNAYEAIMETQIGKKLFEKINATEKVN